MRHVDRLRDAIDTFRGVIAHMPETQEGADAFTSLFEDIEELISFADKRWETIIEAVEQKRKDAMMAEVIAHLDPDGIRVDVKMLTQDARDWVETYYMGDDYESGRLNSEGVDMVAKYRAREATHGK